MKRERLKKRIFDSAFEIVEKEGLNNLTIRKIAKKSDCSLGSIYNVYNNFQIVQLHINEKVFSNLLTNLFILAKQGVESGSSLRSILKDLGEAYIDYGQNNKELWKSLFEYYIEGKLPSWYIISGRKGIDQICMLISDAFNIPINETKQILCFFWTSIHGMCSILLNRKMEMIAELLKPNSVASYIEYCLEGLTKEIDK